MGPTSHTSGDLAAYRAAHAETVGEGSDEWWATDRPFHTFPEGGLNASYNCVDRYAFTHPDRVAIIYEADEPGEGCSITYAQLLREVCALANVHGGCGVDYGGIREVFFFIFRDFVRNWGGGVAAGERAVGCGCGERDGSGVTRAGVFEEGRDAFSPRGRRSRTAPARPSSTFWTRSLGSAALYRLARSCSGVAHLSRSSPSGLQSFLPEKLDTNANDILFRHIVYGPLLSGVPTLMFESTPVYPTSARYWETVAKHKATQFSSAPTAVRLLRRLGPHHVAPHDLTSLRALGSVGEPINPEAWNWYNEHVGHGSVRQTETGSIVITPVPGAVPTKPGSATVPFFGHVPVILHAVSGEELKGNSVERALALASPWPSIARTIWQDHTRYLETYMRPYPGLFNTGDGAARDEEGYIWIRGRVDDVINVSGHRLSTAEIESALIMHNGVAETAGIGTVDELTGRAVYAFVTLKPEFTYDHDNEAPLDKGLVLQVRKVIGPFAAPKKIYIVPDLPKTRSGKIMRRIMRKIVAGEGNQLGDLSTVADPSIVDVIKAKVAEG
ncbi:putative acetate-CoA ligase [Mycena polygramma]|nr:putative acetate-CoA ligase [Mycena polygramma]